MTDFEVYWLIEKELEANKREGVYLINQRDVQLVLEIEMKKNEEQENQDSYLLEGGEQMLLFPLKRMELNDNPTLHCMISEASTAGRSYIGRFRIPLNPKLLKNPPQYRENRGGHIYELQLLREDDVDATDLSQYAKKLSHSSSGREERGNLSFTNPRALSQFEDDIDLHVEQLLDDPADYSRAELLNIQMSTFRKYIEEALRLGKDRVYVIHGIGKGTLKSRIHRELANHPFVDSYSDDYHPKYGNGATEIQFSS